jgi:hypothetical protein
MTLLKKFQNDYEGPDLKSHSHHHHHSSSSSSSISIQAAIDLCTEVSANFALTAIDLRTQATIIAQPNGISTNLVTACAALGPFG